MQDQNDVTYVTSLPNLMTREDYRAANQNRIRFQLKITDKGVEILGDSPHPFLLDELLKALEARKVEKVLCG